MAYYDVVTIRKDGSERIQHKSTGHNKHPRVVRASPIIQVHKRKKNKKPVVRVRPRVRRPNPLTAAINEFKSSLRKK